MATQCKRKCPYPGCPTLTLGGYCKRHKKGDRASAIDRGYGHAWTRLRNWYIKNHPVCEIREICDGAAAVEVDHIKPIDQGGERLDPTNLQSTCKRCHSWKTRHTDTQTGG